MTEQKATISSQESSKPTRGIFSRSILEHRSLVARAEPLAQPADVSYVDIELPISKHVRLPVQGL